jgi:hypothetical protein
MFKNNIFIKEAHINDGEHINEGTSENLKNIFEEGFQGFEAWKKGVEKCVTANTV